MKKEIIINATANEIRVAITEDGRLAELFLEVPDKERHVGSIYLGKVQRVVQGMNAAFVDIGETQDAFLHFSDASNVSDDYKDLIDEKDDLDVDDDDLSDTETAEPVHLAPKEGGREGRRSDRSKPDGDGRKSSGRNDRRGGEERRGEHRRGDERPAEERHAEEPAAEERRSDERRPDDRRGDDRRGDGRRGGDERRGERGDGRSKAPEGRQGTEGGAQPTPQPQPERRERDDRRGRPDDRRQQAEPPHAEHPSPSTEAAGETPARADRGDRGRDRNDRNRDRNDRSRDGRRGGDRRQQEQGRPQASSEVQPGAAGAQPRGEEARDEEQIHDFDLAPDNQSAPETGAETGLPGTEGQGERKRKRRRGRRGRGRNRRNEEQHGEGQSQEGTESRTDHGDDDADERHENDRRLPAEPVRAPRPQDESERRESGRNRESGREPGREREQGQGRQPGNERQPGGERDRNDRRNDGRRDQDRRNDRPGQNAPRPNEPQAPRSETPQERPYDRNAGAPQDRPRDRNNDTSQNRSYDRNAEAPRTTPAPEQREERPISTEGNLDTPGSAPESRQSGDRRRNDRRGGRRGRGGDRERGQQQPRAEGNPPADDTAAGAPPTLREPREPGRGEPGRESNERRERAPRAEEQTNEPRDRREVPASPAPERERPNRDQLSLPIGELENKPPQAEQPAAEPAPGKRPARERRAPRGRSVEASGTETPTPTTESPVEASEPPVARKRGQAPRGQASLPESERTYTSDQPERPSTPPPQADESEQPPQRAPRGGRRRPGGGGKSSEGGVRDAKLPTFQTKRSGEVTIALEKGQDVIVQVTRESYASKGVRVTTKASLPGRFLVLLPLEPSIGISRKVQHTKERRRLRRIAKGILPEGYGCIIRTVAQDKEEEVISQDLTKLIDTWREIEHKMKSVTSPALLYKDQSIANTVMRDLFTPDIDRVVIDNKILFREIHDYVTWAAPNLSDKVELHNGDKPIFEAYGVEKEIEKMFHARVYLPSGGYIILEQTEAMMVIDVNSGRYASNKEQELNSLRTNLEAAREIARQIRLRDIGGLLVVDFIDLYEEKNRKKVYDELKKEMRRDRAKSVVLPMTQFGLVQMTRQRIRQQLIQTISEPCPICSGSGLVQSKSTVVRKIERWLGRFKESSREFRLTLTANPVIIDYLTEGSMSRLTKLMLKYFVRIKVVPDESMPVDEFHFFSLRQQTDITDKYMVKE